MLFVSAVHISLKYFILRHIKAYLRIYELGGPGNMGQLLPLDVEHVADKCCSTRPIVFRPFGSTLHCTWHVSKEQS